MKLLALCLALVPVALGIDMHMDLDDYYNHVMGHHGGHSDMGHHGGHSDMGHHGGHSGGDSYGHHDSYGSDSGDHSGEDYAHYTHGEQFEKELDEFIHKGEDKTGFKDYLARVSHMEELRKEEAEKAREEAEFRHKQEQVAHETARTNMAVMDSKMDFKYKILEQFVGTCKCDDSEGAVDVLMRVDKGEFAMRHEMNESEPMPSGNETHHSNNSMPGPHGRSVMHDVYKFAHFADPMESFYYAVEEMAHDLCYSLKAYLHTLSGLEEQVMEYRNNGSMPDRNNGSLPDLGPLSQP